MMILHPTKDVMKSEIAGDANCNDYTIKKIPQTKEVKPSLVWGKIILGYSDIRSYIRSLNSNTEDAGCCGLL